MHHTRDVTAECNTFHILYDVNEYLVYVERLKQKLLLYRIRYISNKKKNTKTEERLTSLFSCKHIYVIATMSIQSGGVVYVVNNQNFIYS